MGHLMQITVVTSQSADNGNWLAAIMLIAGISFPLQFERNSSSLLIFGISQWQEAIATTKHRAGFQLEMRENYQS
jgi:hypothetical protein